MRILAFMPGRQQCGVSDYTHHLYADARCLGPDILVQPLALTLWNCLTAPFRGAELIHLQHEYSLFGFAGWKGFVLLLYWLGLRLGGTRLVLTLHTVYDWNRTEQLFGHRTQSRLLLALLRWYGKAYHRLMLADASLLVFLGEASRRAFLAVTPAASRAQSVTIPIGVYDLPPGSDNSAALSARYGVAPDDYVLTLFGFAYPNKGYHLAIEALKRLGKELPRLRLLIVSGEPAEGGRQYLEQLRQLAADSQLGPRVVFTGYIPAEDPLFDAVLARTDCFLYPYLRESANSGSLATTLSARKLYLTSELEMFRDFTPGLKFRAGDAADLAAKIKQVAALSPAERSDYRRRLDSYIEENNLPAMRKKHVAAFLSICA